MSKRRRLLPPAFLLASRGLSAAELVPVTLTVTVFTSMVEEEEGTAVAVAVAGGIFLRPAEVALLGAGGGR